MANLKLDLINKLRERKYYDEMELVRLAQEPNMNYEEKIILMDEKLEKIALTDSKIHLTDQYFQDAPQENEPQSEVPQQEQPTNPAPQPQQPPAAHPGQTHGE